MPLPTADILRVYYIHPVTAACGCCGIHRRVNVIDLDCQTPLCASCLAASVQAAEMLRRAGLPPPDHALINLNP